MSQSVFAIADQDLRTDPIINLKRLSDFGELKIYRWGNASITPDGDGNGFADIPHDLNYAPSYDLFVKLPDGYWSPVGAASSLAFGDATATIFGVSDEEKLRIQTIGGYSKLASLQRDFRYYILVDKAEGFNGSSNIALTGDRGMKLSEDDVNVFEGQEYQMRMSTKYRSLQYFKEHVVQETLSLPLMFSSHDSQDNIESQYVDFDHGLGYPPLFKAFYGSGSTLRKIPDNAYAAVQASDIVTQAYYTSFEVVAKCNSDRVRLQFRRRSVFDKELFLGENGGSHFPPGQLISAVQHQPKTITVTIQVYTENLEGSVYGE